jgi:hypothetical protein
VGWGHQPADVSEWPRAELHNRHGKKEIGLAVGNVLGRYKMGKHLQLTIEEDRFDWQRKPASIERGTALDGSYVIRTSVPASDLTLVNKWWPPTRVCPQWSALFAA